jgi:hypothetical protein
MSAWLPLTGYDAARPLASDHRERRIEYDTSLSRRAQSIEKRKSPRAGARKTAVESGASLFDSRPDVPPHGRKTVGIGMLLLYMLRMYDRAIDPLAGPSLV